jgi:hypothetical protein
VSHNLLLILATGLLDKTIRLLIINPAFDPSSSHIHLLPLARSEKAQLATSEQQASQAYAAWKDAERQELPQEKVEELKGIAMEKDQILRSMQDLCD